LVGYSERSVLLISQQITPEHQDGEKDQRGERGHADPDVIFIGPVTGTLRIM